LRFNIIVRFGPRTYRHMLVIGLKCMSFPIQKGGVIFTTRRRTVTCPIILYLVVIDSNNPGEGRMGGLQRRIAFLLGVPDAIVSQRMNGGVGYMPAADMSLFPILVNIIAQEK